MPHFHIVDIATGTINLGSFATREEAEAGLAYERAHGVLSKSFDGEGEHGEEFEIVAGLPRSNPSRVDTMRTEKESMYVVETCASKAMDAFPLFATESYAEAGAVCARLRAQGKDVDIYDVRMLSERKKGDPWIAIRGYKYIKEIID